jgi:hypothetical protein
MDVPRLMPPSSRAGGGIRCQICLSVSEFLVSRHWRAAQGSPQGGQVAITKGVENYPGFIEIGGFELCDKFLQHAKSYDLEILEKEAEATEPGIDCHAAQLADGTVLKAHALILAAADGCTAALAAAHFIETRK